MHKNRKDFHFCFFVNRITLLQDIDKQLDPFTHFRIDILKSSSWRIQMGAYLQPPLKCYARPMNMLRSQSTSCCSFGKKKVEKGVNWGWWWSERREKTGQWEDSSSSWPIMWRHTLSYAGTASSLAYRSHLTIHFSTTSSLSVQKRLFTALSESTRLPSASTCMEMNFLR